MGASKKTVLWFEVRGLKAGLGVEGGRGVGVDGGGGRDGIEGGEMEEKFNLKKQVVAVLSTKELEKKKRIKYQAAPAAPAAPTAPTITTAAAAATAAAPLPLSPSSPSPPPPTRTTTTVRSEILWWLMLRETPVVSLIDDSLRSRFGFVPLERW
ncbi:hypothetical protein V1478_018695 [Vespula squamosa]|uniref:Uncharacterized protein n=1 Tax=Vespula squamosa TaxID=30214 RepID=A0ABD1ZTH3_VESSQ